MKNGFLIAVLTVAKIKIRYYGTGTKKVEEELQTLLPDSRILRMDVDTTRRKGAHEKIFANIW